jgi:uncharacterized protein YxjI
MRYPVRERLFDIKDDFWVTDERGDRVFYVNAKFLSLHHTLVLEDASRRKLASIKHHLLTFTDAIDIEHDGTKVATVHRAVFSPLHHRAHIDLRHGGGRLEAVGNIIDKDFEIRDGHHVVARVSRKWLSSQRRGPVSPRRAPNRHLFIQRIQSQIFNSPQARRSGTTHPTRLSSSPRADLHVIGRVAAAFDVAEDGIRD